MLTVVDRPAIQHVVEEAAGAGLDQVIIVTNGSKPSMEDHFSDNPEFDDISIRFVLQAEPLGLGHAVLVTADAVGSEPFVVMLPDQLTRPGSQTLASIIAAYASHSTSVVALHEVPPHEVRHYGCAAIEALGDNVVRVPYIVEKPQPEDAPSNHVVKARYLFTPGIFDHLRETEPGLGGEIQLTDAMAQLARTEGLLGVVDNSPSWDTGQLLGYLRAQVGLGMLHEELGDEFAAVLRDAVAGLDSGLEQQ
jgi:UTP--glucose-1-phosphate uridylyltransferase